MKRRAFLAGTGSVSLSLAIGGCGGEKEDVRAEQAVPSPKADGPPPVAAPSQRDVAFGGDGSTRVFTNDGRIFALTADRHTMDVFSASGARVKTVGALTKKPTNALGDLNGPVAAYWDEARGRLFVLERGNERIQTFDGEGNALAIHAKTSAAFDLNSDPLTDEIYVAASSAHMIEVYSKTRGRSLGAVGRFGTDEAGLNGPVSVALHENVLHIVDAGNRKIKVLTRDGRLVRSYGGGNLLVQPRSIRFDGQGRAWVSDTFGAALVVFDSEGNRLARFEPELPSSKKRAAPTSLARRSDGTIYAALIAAAA